MLIDTMFVVNSFFLSCFSFPFFSRWLFLTYSYTFEISPISA